MATLQTIRYTLNAHEPASKEHSEIKALLVVFIFADPQHEVEDCLTAPREYLTIDRLYNLNNLRGLTTMFRILREYLVFKGLEYTAHPQNRQIQFGLVSSFFQSEDDVQLAFQSLQYLWTSTITNPKQLDCEARAMEKMTMTRADWLTAWPNGSRRTIDSPAN